MLRLAAGSARALLWLLLTSWCLVALSWGLLHWVIVPRIGNWKPELEQAATQALGLRVEIGALQAESTSLLPRLTLRGLMAIPEPAGDSQAQRAPHRDRRHNPQRSASPMNKRGRPPGRMTHRRRQVLDEYATATANGGRISWAELARRTGLHSYNDARRIGEDYRDGVPVIMNLTELEDVDAKRIIDFAAGLVFGMLIVVLSCHQGLSVTQGAVGVGRGTTRAMVYSSLAILIVNFFLSIALNYRYLPIYER